MALLEPPAWETDERVINARQRAYTNTFLLMLPIGILGAIALVVFTDAWLAALIIGASSLVSIIAFIALAGEKPWNEKARTFIYTDDKIRSLRRKRAIILIIIAMLVGWVAYCYLTNKPSGNMIYWTLLFIVAYIFSFFFAKLQKEKAPGQT